VKCRVLLYNNYMKKQPWVFVLAYVPLCLVLYWLVWPAYWKLGYETFLFILPSLCVIFIKNKYIYYTALTFLILEWLMVAIFAVWVTSFN
jgi:hypothetical protein